MTSAVSAEARYDRTDLANILRSGIALGLLQSALVAGFGFLQPRLDGVLELVICGVILLVGLALTLALPGSWTRARTIEGISGAAGIGFAAAIVFLIVDVILFQPLGLYTNRWLAIGGGLNWWYHPVWWMVGTYLTLMGAWVMANQTEKAGTPLAMGLPSVSMSGSRPCAASAKPSAAAPSRRTPACRAACWARTTC